MESIYPHEPNNLLNSQLLYYCDGIIRGLACLEAVFIYDLRVMHQINYVICKNHYKCILYYNCNFCIEKNANVHF